VYTDEKVYDLLVKAEKEENVDLSRYGDVPSIKFEPEATFQGLFVRKGRLFMWVSDDDRRICTQIQAKIPVASVRLKLEEVEGPGNDFWITHREPEKEKRRSARPGWRRRRPSRPDTSQNRFVLLGSPRIRKTAYDH
jgi:hypothetical protein